jgi:hypothetical protein
MGVLFIIGTLGTLFPELTFASRLINTALPSAQGAFDEAM